MIAVLPSSSSVMSASSVFGTSDRCSHNPSRSRRLVLDIRPRRGGASAPEVTPAAVVDDLDATLAQHIQARGIAVGLSVIDARDVGVDDHLGAHYARRRADEHHLARQLGAGFDQSVLLRVNAVMYHRRLAYV